MAFHGIAEALVYHSAALMYNPHAGNLQLMAEIAPYPTCTPAGCSSPTRRADPPVTQVMASLLGSGVRAALLLPRSYRFSLRRWNMGPILARWRRIASPPLWISASVIGTGRRWTGMGSMRSARPILPAVDPGARRYRR